MNMNRRGLTLVELLVVLVILFLLVGLLLPAQRRVGGAAERTVCANNHKQLMIALHTYADLYPAEKSEVDNRGPSFPTGCYGAPNREPDERLSWNVRILPFIEQEKLFREFDPKIGLVADSTAALEPLSVFVCPASKRKVEPITTYVGLAGLGEGSARRREADAANGIMGYDRGCAFKDVTDGMSNTIALAETNGSLGRWAQGGFGTLRSVDLSEPLGPDGRFGSAHKGGFNVALCDGSVRFIKFTQDAEVFAQSVTVAGGEKVSLD